ncbi:ABC transporter ATP-binding protein [Pseudofrankia inefficax]|uniref:ABC transporter related protein n=1 Tax=Pseudofrankia inefficax (strain DSM 45817 / CECT 9037 / DDB 130130 / EuI1c) TaxID=298654 RepID=E3J3V6_PSEI1|nr:ABC transporter ATP-binding protein [Pseudofrankia inefficax]ADP80589.1 ABC transporter related protein [Pseudofrankia inefficax]
MPAIEIAALRKAYGGRPVVRDLDLTVEAGECFALLGPNGAGKTTTVEILEGFRSRDGGRVTVLGHDPAAATRSWRARTGVVAQTTGAALDLTVAEAVRHFAGYHAAPRPTDELIDAVGLTEQAGTRIEALSGGQRRRLDVALGVQGRPELLFLDEPTTGLDPQGRRQVWELVEALRAQGTTILLTTHYLDEAAQLCDRVGVITHGQLIETAPTAEFGGRLRDSATVRWRDGGQVREVRTPTPTAVVRDLLAATPDGEIEDLEILRPTLEEIYLALLEKADRAAAGPVSDDPVSDDPVSGDPAPDTRSLRRGAAAGPSDLAQPRAPRAVLRSGS